MLCCTRWGTEAETIARHRATAADRLSDLIRGELDWIVLKAIDKDRDRRYQTASALGDDVSRYLADDVIEARPPSSIYRLQKFVRRNRTFVLTVVASLVTLAATSVVGTYLAWRALSAESLANSRLISEQTARRQAEDSRSRAITAEEEAAAEASKASREAAISQAVLEFLDRDLLSQSSPDGTSLGNVTLRTVLDRASRKIGSRFVSEPAVEAKIREVIGDTYAGHGEHALALQHLRRAWQLQTSLSGSDAAQTLSLANRVAESYLNQGLNEQAAKMLDDLRPKANAHLGESDPVTLRALTLTAKVYEARGQLELAHQLHEEVLAAWMERAGDTYPETLVAMSNLAGAYQARGELERAAPLLKRAYEQLSRRAGLSHPQTRVALNKLAELYLEQGRSKEAGTFISRDA